MDKDIIYFGFNNIQARVIVAFRQKNYQMNERLQSQFATKLHSLLPIFASE